MSIHACTECGGKVSTLAASCPHCGAPSPAGNLATLTVVPEATSDRELSSLVNSNEFSKNQIECIPDATAIPARVTVAPLLMVSSLVKSDEVAIARIASLKVTCKWISVACYVLAITLIVYPAEKSFEGILKAIFEPIGYGYGWVGLVVKHWPSSVLIVIGKIASNKAK